MKANVYGEYGFHITNNSYFICHDKKVINALFDRLRKWEDGKEKTYPKTLGKFEISGIRDLTNGFDSRESDKKAVSSHNLSVSRFGYYVQVKFLDTQIVRVTEI